MLSTRQKSREEPSVSRAYFASSSFEMIRSVSCLRPLCFLFILIYKLQYVMIRRDKCCETTGMTQSSYGE